jgi:hypothetical protein
MHKQQVSICKYIGRGKKERVVEKEGRADAADSNLPGG